MALSSPAPPFILRDVAQDDLADLQETAVHLDSVNLPNDRDALKRIIDVSLQSFSGQLPKAERCFVFVMRDEARGRVVGTSMIFAQHGSRRAPHVYFDVIEEERYSETLDRHFSHRLLRIGYNYKGLTEIGGLVVRPEYRGHPQQLGRLLSYVRFLYIGLHRSLFCDEVVSELMPPLEPDGTSLLWEALGRRFTGLSYQEADALSRQNKEFIRALFPQDPLYATLLPANVQALIGEVGPETKGVESMLRAIGFEYAQRIDPFDGGPHFHARTDDVTLVREVRRARVVLGPADGRSSGAPAPPQAEPGPLPSLGFVGPARSLLVAREAAAPPFLIAARVEAPLPVTLPTPGAGLAASRASPTPNGATLSLPVEVAAALRLRADDEAAVLPLPPKT